jgi:hypothetical protein
MGFRREITTRDGITHANAYYKVSGIRISHHAQRVSVSMMVWKDQDARNANKATLSGVPDKTSFLAKDADYDTYFAPTVIDTDGKNAVSQAYVYAKAKINDPAIVDIDPDA